MAVLSDKQTGLVPAMATTWPHNRHPFCQAHYLRNLAQPLAETDSAFNMGLRKAVRQQIGDLIRQEPRSTSGPGGVLIVTGLLPTAMAAPRSSSGQPRRHLLTTPLSPTDTVVSALLRDTRYLLTLKGRLPFRLAGIATFERLEHLARFGFDLLARRSDTRVAHLVQGLQSALKPLNQSVEVLQRGAAWLRDIAYILEPSGVSRHRGNQVANQLRVYLDSVLRWPHLPPALQAFGRHLDKVSRSYWPGLFHCDKVPGLARTNHDLESRFRDTMRRLLRTTGEKEAHVAHPATPRGLETAAWASN